MWVFALHPFLDPVVTTFLNLVGRPFIYGLAVAGEEGVEQVIRDILADLEITLGLSGYKNLDEIRGKADEIMVRLD